MGMGYVQPSGDIWLFEGVPLSPDHNDVFYITSNANAMEKLKGYPSKPYGANSYTRTERGTLKIGDNANRLLTYNYLAWKNIRSDGIQMWFFAFVTNIGYVNENCTEVSYVIDNYMTWFGFTRLGACYVDREIPETDNIGEHTIDEGIDTGDLVCSFHTTYDFGKDLYYLFQASTDHYGQPSNTYINGIQCPIHMEIRPVGMEITDIINFYHGYNELGKGCHLDEIKFNGITLYSMLVNDVENTNNPDNMISVNIIPKFLADKVGAQTDGISKDTYHFARERDLNGYTPKNNKMYCYPYSRINVSNNAGTVTEYKWELFSFPQSMTVDFDIIGATMGNPTIMCYPILYDNVGDNYDHSITITNFPPIPWINDTYKAFIAQNKANIVSSCIGLVTGLGSSAVGAYTQNRIVANEGTAFLNNWNPSIHAQGNAAGAVVSGVGSAVQNVLGMIQEKRDHQFAPKTIANLSQADLIMLLAERMRFDFYNVTVKREMAKSIDDFFSAFGYAIHKIKRPYISGRPYWNYVKTSGLVFESAPIPAQAKNEIINAFDKGIRIWKDPSTFGNLSLDNSING